MLFSSQLDFFFIFLRKSIFVFWSSNTSSFAMISQEHQGIKPWCSLHPCAVISLPHLFLLQDRLTQIGKSISFTICSFSLNVFPPFSLGPFSLLPHIFYCKPQLAIEANLSTAPHCLIVGCPAAVGLSPQHLWHLCAWHPAQGFAIGCTGLQLKLTVTRHRGIKNLRIGNQEPADQHHRNMPEKGQNFYISV